MAQALPKWVEDYIAAVPESALIRGMFFRWVDEFCAVNDLIPPAEKRIDFKFYPTTDFLYYLCWGLQPLATEVGYEQALRQMGQFIYDSFRKTILGRSVFSGVLSLRSLLKVGPRAYHMLLDDSAEVEVTFPNDHEAHVSLEGVWVFNDTLGVGTWEGVLTGYGVEGAVDIVKSNQRDGISLRIRWEPKEKKRSLSGLFSSDGSKL